MLLWVYGSVTFTRMRVGERGFTPESLPSFWVPGAWEGEEGLLVPWEPFFRGVARYALRLSGPSEADDESGFS